MAIVMLHSEERCYAFEHVERSPRFVEVWPRDDTEQAAANELARSIFETATDSSTEQGMQILVHDEPQPTA